MSERIHGRAVRNLVISSGKTYTRESLLETIHENFGKDARFFSCAEESLTADELITFFERAGKLSAPDYNFSESRDHVCKLNIED